MTSNNTIQDRVAAGATWLDETRPTWINEVDLEQLELRSCERCVLGQIVVMERDRFTSTDEDELRLVMDILDGFDCLIEPLEVNLDVIADVDSLFDLVMTGDRAVERGFHVDDDYNYAVDDEWQELTDEWRRVIVARRGVKP